MIKSRWWWLWCCCMFSGFCSIECEYHDTSLNSGGGTTTASGIGRGYHTNIPATNHTHHTILSFMSCRAPSKPPKETLTLHENVERADVFRLSFTSITHTQMLSKLDAFDDELNTVTSRSNCTTTTTTIGSTCSRGPSPILASS